MGDERRLFSRLALAAVCLLIAGCRPGSPDAEALTQEDAAEKAPTLSLTLTADNAGETLPRELEEEPLGLGMTLEEATLRIPALTRDRTLGFAAPPTYFVSAEISATHLYVLSRPRNAVTLHARPAGGALGSVELYGRDGAIAALRGLYAQSEIRAVPYEEFVARALKRYGNPSRSESSRYSDGTVVRYDLWQNPRTTILIGETDSPKAALASRYIYFIDGGLLRDSYRAARTRGSELSARTSF
jgi:hypothetical protein